MTRRIAVGLAAIAIAAGLATNAADAQTPVPDDTPIVQLGIFAARQADGRGGGGTYATSDRDTSLRTDVYIMPCSFGSSSRMPTLAYTTWHVEGQVLRQTPQDAVVRVTWRRMRAAGQSVTGPSSTTELTLTVGQHIVLDQEAMPALGECGPMSVTLEARYEPRMSGMFAFTPNGRATRGGGSSGRASTTARGDDGSAQSSTGAGGGRLVAQSEAAGAQPSGAGTTTGGVNVGGGMVMATARGADGRAAGSLLLMQSAELWLVHSAPDKDDEVLQTSTIARSGGGDFAFAPVAIQTKTGAVAVRITGTLELGLDLEGRPRFVFGATRRVMFTPSTRAPRDRTASVDSGGVANTILPVPSPDEVLSFEMPPIDAAGVPQVPDHFAIRVRLSPMTMRGVGAGGARAETR
jgi:hypothetical protein